MFRSRKTQNGRGASATLLAGLAAAMIATTASAEPRLPPPPQNNWAPGAGWQEWSAQNWQSVSEDAPLQLELSPEQQGLWSNARAATQKAREEARASRDDYQDRLRQWSQATPSPKALAAARQSAWARREKAEEGAESAWESFYESLTAPQRQQWGLLARSRMEHWGERLRMSRRWETTPEWMGRDSGDRR
jgi:hypothetical protein